MLDRLANATGWTCYAAGTGLAASSSEIVGVGLAVAGLVTVVGQAMVRVYRDALAIRAAQEATAFRHQLQLIDAQGKARHDVLTIELDRLRDELARSRCPYVTSSGLARCIEAPPED